MHPKDYTVTWIHDWFKAEEDKKHSMAVKYIEENVDLIDTDLPKFMNDCPSSCRLEVYEMLLKAGIDMGDYVISSSLKQWEIYVYDYKQKMDEYITDTIEWKTHWRRDTIILD